MDYLKDPILSSVCVFVFRQSFDNLWYPQKVFLHEFGLTVCHAQALVHHNTLYVY
jgi:hypothetical protein